MYVKVSIKGDLEQNKKLADIIEDIMSKPRPTYNIIHSKYFSVSDWSIGKPENREH